MTSRPRLSLTVALALMLLLGAGHLFVSFAPDASQIPLVVVYGDMALGLLSLVAAFGLAKRARWGQVLTLVIAVLTVVSAVPGVVAAPNLALHVITAAYLVLSLVIFGLVAVPSNRGAFAPQTPSQRE